MRRIDIAIASPGDVSDEREAIPRVFVRWNDRNTDAMLHPVMWESTSVPTLGDHPQHILNRQIIDRSELLLAILWSKLGTPTPTARSGTVEEIQQFIAIKGPGRVMLYFCTRNLPYDTDPADLAKLREFKAEMRSKGLYHEYASVEEFERVLYQHLDAKVAELLQGRLPTPEGVATAPPKIGRELSEHSDARLRRLIEFGTALEEIASGFAKRMADFDAVDGSNNDKFLDLAAHVYNSVASCLDRYLLFSAAGISEQDKSVLEKISIRLKRLGACPIQYVGGAFTKYWSDGREISEALSAHVQFLGNVRRR